MQKLGGEQGGVKFWEWNGGGVQGPGVGWVWIGAKVRSVVQVGCGGRMGLKPTIF